MTPRARLISQFSVRAQRALIQAGDPTAPSESGFDDASAVST